jgi:hypothetical protein
MGGVVTGSLCLRCGGRCYSLILSDRGWLAVELLRYLDEVLGSDQQPAAILKLLGLTLVVESQPPPRDAHHWIEVDIDNRRLASNSDLVRKAVKRQPPDPDDPVTATTLERIYTVLDRFDFTAELYPSRSRR